MKGPPRVVLFTWRLSPAGGIPRVVRDLVTGLAKERFALHVVSVRARAAEDELEALADQATLHFLDVTGGGLRARALAGARLAAVLRRVQPDIVHLHSGTASYALLPVAVFARKARRLLEVHDAAGQGRHSRATEVVEAAMIRRLGYRPLAHSSSVAEATARAGGVDTRSVAVIPLGIDPEQYTAPPGSRARWRAAHGIERDDVVVLYVARMVASKNVGLFLEVAGRSAHLHDVVFVVVGGGPDLRAVEEQSRRMGLGRRLQVLGPVDSTLDAYWGSDVFASTSDYEGFGLAVLEAMAAGLPVVATAVGGITDLVEHRATGLLALPGDADGLSRGVEELASDPALRQSLGQAGAGRARTRFSRHDMLSAYEGLYTSLATGRHGIAR